MKRRLLFLLTCLTIITGVAMAKTVRGVVTDASDKEPIVGASVFVKGTSVGASTNIDGEFSLNVPDNAKTLVVSYIGMTTREVAITDGTMKIELTSSAQDLDEVVVVAYGTQKKSSITGAITQVKSEEIAKRPVSSATAALEGLSPGITVTSNYGSPGSSPSIQIRGVTTVNGSTSILYVVDGVPYGGNITDLNPDDIESMSVLKDAASAALYGNRAANGVILITTKKAKSERVQFTFKTNHGWYERALPEYETVSPDQYMKLAYVNWANKYREENNLTYGELANHHSEIATSLLSDYLYNNIYTIRDITELYNTDGSLNPEARIIDSYAEDLDWFDQATRKGYRGEYLFSGSGATNKSDYYFSTGYLKENGYMNDSGYERFTGRASINIRPASWLKSGFSINASHQKYGNTAAGAGDDSDAVKNPFNFCRYMAPIYPVHLHDINTGEYILDGNGNKQYDQGTYIGIDEDGIERTIQTRGQSTGRHVIMENELDKNRTTRNTMNAIAYADIILPYGFTASVKGNLSTRNTLNKAYRSAEIGDAKISGGSFSETAYNYKTWTLQEQLRWSQIYNKIHTIDVLIGHENYSTYSDYFYSAKKGEAFPNIGAFANFSEMNSVSGYRTKSTTESYLARVQYNYDDRYNIEASWRRDGSSRFHPNNRWGNFGSVGANWMFSNEEFMKKYTWLNSGKLRADWGQVGNDRGSGEFAYMSLFTTSSMQSNPAYYFTQRPATDLVWETSESWGVAIEARMFNRWNVTLEYFDKRSKDLIFNVYDPLSSGATSNSSAISTTTMNIGSISNRGWEFATDVDVYKSKDWTVNLGINMTTLSNKVLKLPEQNKRLTKEAIDPSMPVYNGIISGSTIIAEGMSRHTRYLKHWVGVDMLDGRSLYEPNLVDYHIVTGEKDQYGNDIIIGGRYTINDDGSYQLDENGNKKITSTALKEGEYRVINGKYYVTKPTFASYSPQGSSMPKVYGSFNASVRYKNFNLSAMLQYSIGGKVYDAIYAGLISPSTSASNLHVDALNYWTGCPEGMTEDSPNRINPNINPEFNTLHSSDDNSASDRFLIDRSYLCLKNINLSYTLPRFITNKLQLSSVRLNFSAENIHTWSKLKGMNPMVSLSGGTGNYLVPARVFTFGLNVTI